MTTYSSTSETRTPQTITGIRADLFVNMDRDQAARLIRDLATALAECDTVALRVRVEDLPDWSTGEKVGHLTISDLRYGIAPASGIVADCSVVIA